MILGAITLAILSKLNVMDVVYHTKKKTTKQNKKSRARLTCTHVFLGFVKVGGYNGLWEKYGQSMGTPYTPVNATNTSSNGTDLSSCFALTPHWDHMFRPINDPDYPWLGLWTTLPIMGIWYWCTDQVCLRLHGYV